nr:RNA-guided endonuclease TnpB family protein [Dethiosulfatibacter aminovorans]
MAKRMAVKEKNRLLADQGKQVKNYGLVLRLYPNDEQAELINKTVGCSRLVYNMYLADRKEDYEEHGSSLSVAKYKKEVLVPLKSSEEYGFLKEVDKFALEVACENVDDAYNRFFKGQNSFPQFRSKRKAKKTYTTKMTNNNIKVIGCSSIKLPKLGKVGLAKQKTKRNKYILKKIREGRIRILKATISQKGAHYYVSLTLEEIVDKVEPLDISQVDISKVIGIDLGLKTFATVNDGTETEFVKKVKYITESEEKLAKLQRKLSRKQVDSQNFKKARNKIASLQEHIANQRKDFAHKLSSRIANENQVVVMESLNIKGMGRNRRLAKAISDAGWHQFQGFLKYKLEWQGKHLIKLAPWYASSKICSNCQEKHIALSLNHREWVCSKCGTAHERDENAAINIRNQGLETLGLISIA